MEEYIDKEFLFLDGKFSLEFNQSIMNMFLVMNIAYIFALLVFVPSTFDENIPLIWYQLYNASYVFLIVNTFILTIIRVIISRKKDIWKYSMEIRTMGIYTSFLLAIPFINFSTKAMFFLDKKYGYLLLFLYAFLVVGLIFYNVLTLKKKIRARLLLWIKKLICQYTHQ